MYRPLAISALWSAKRVVFSTNRHGSGFGEQWPLISSGRYMFPDISSRPEKGLIFFCRPAPIFPIAPGPGPGPKSFNGSHQCGSCRPEQRTPKRLVWHYTPTRPQSSDSYAGSLFPRPFLLKFGVVLWGQPRADVQVGERAKCPCAKLC